MNRFSERDLRNGVTILPANGGFILVWMEKEVEKRMVREKVDDILGFAKDVLVEMIGEVKA